MNIPDEAVEAAGDELAMQIMAEPIRELHPRTRKAFRADAKAILSAALPAIERAHLERLAKAALDDAYKPSDGKVHDAWGARNWLRARLDQTKEKP
jgi:2-phospho-L-lactate guanylyltransferase (CobY/MobA/RfbA family)